ncbi:hypothetical protein [Paenibacillus flagellatus]|uniref:hypothetical protein n=1 Tax=Paenibacillus flagellatus TaxID=2211139 RepID=UPI0013052E5E|nr:hypothetical protein [Paenibacillus flagellatus]
MNERKTETGAEQLEQTVRAEQLGNPENIETEGPVQAKQNHKLDNSKIEVE